MERRKVRTAQSNVPVNSRVPAVLRGTDSATENDCLTLSLRRGQGEVENVR